MPGSEIEAMAFPRAYVVDSRSSRAIVLAPPPTKNFKRVEIMRKKVLLLNFYDQFLTCSLVRCPFSYVA